MENSHSNINKSTTKLLFFYGLGDAGTGLAAALLGFHLFRFLTCAAGLDPLLAGSILMIIKLWDAINDPLIGRLSDKTQTKWGPRIPWMILSSIPLSLSLAAIWWIPEGRDVIDKTIYYAVISIILMTGYTGVNLPFSALSTELSEETSLRVKLNASRFKGSICASLAGLVIAGLILREAQSAYNYFLIGIISGLFVFICTIFSCWGIASFAKKARKPTGKIEPLVKQFKRIFTNKKFIKVIGLFFLLWCSLQLMQTLAIIYVEDVLNVPTGIANLVPIPFMVSALLGLQIWSRVSNSIGRISALKYGSIFWIFSCSAALIFPSFSKSYELGFSFLNDGNNQFLFFLLMIIISFIGIGASIAYLIPWSLLPDAIDEDPEKPAGIYTAWMVLVQKIGIGVSVQVLGILLFLSGYKACIIEENTANIIQQSSFAQLTIRICIGLIPSILVAYGLNMMKTWNKKNKIAKV